VAIDHQGGATLRKVAGWTFCLLLLDLLLPELGLATNGLNLIGSGGISSALAGADTAVALDFTTMNANPAGIAELRGTHAGLAINMLKAQLRLQNSANAKDGENDPVVIPNAGLVQSIKGTPITVGIGFFTIGGTTSDFRGVTTAFGTVDKEGTQLRYYKLTPTIAYQVTKDLSVGVSLAISYADVSLTIFPNTPLIPGAAAGFETTGKCNRANGLAFPPTSCGYDVGFTPKFGALYKVTDTVTVGVAYTMKTPITFDHGQISKSYLTCGGCTSTYDYKAFGFKWADDVAVGVSYRPTPSLLVATKFQWINWDGALNNVVVRLTNGSNPAAPPSDSFVLNYNWRDQYVIAIGALYDVTDRFSVRGGYNYGNNPVPKTTLDPTNANIVQHHIAAGLGYRVTPGLLLDIWSTYGVQEQRTVDSALYGANTTLKVGGYEVGITLTYIN
jgi:long-chain fatty acid transport protein